MATPVVKSAPGGRSTTWQKPISLCRGDPLPAALAPKTPETPRATVELTSHLRPVTKYSQQDEEEETVTEEQPSTREQEYVAFWRERGRSEEDARAEFRKYDAGAASPSERIRLGRERYAAEEAAAKEAEQKRKDVELKDVPQHYRTAWDRQGLPLEEQKKLAGYIPPGRHKSTEEAP